MSSADSPRTLVLPGSILDCLPDLNYFGVAVPDAGVIYGQILLCVGAQSLIIFK